MVLVGTLALGASQSTEAASISELMAQMAMGDRIYLPQDTENALYRTAKTGQTQDIYVDMEHVRAVSLGKKYPDGCDAVGMADFTHDRIRNFRVCVADKEIYERNDGVSPTWSGDAGANETLMGTVRQALLYGDAVQDYYDYEIRATRMGSVQGGCGLVEATISSGMFLVANDASTVCMSGSGAVSSR